jgi:hypothetical protein
MNIAECRDCGGSGEAPTAATRHLASVRPGGFEHPAMQFEPCATCSGTGEVPPDSLDPARYIPEHLITRSTP